MSIGVQLDWLLRLLVAALCGSMIGYDRSSRLKNAGIRTHTIVAIGAALAMIISKYGFYDILAHNNIALDPSRIAAQIISGISFIGAGTILVKNDGVNGLTTAAGVWTTAVVGMAVGAGLYFISIVSALFIVLVQRIIRDGFLLQHIIRHVALHLRVEINNNQQEITELKQTLTEAGVQDVKVQILHISKDRMVIQLYGKVEHSFNRNRLLLTVSSQSNVKKVQMD
ncbi:MgtC/SapB family protein [Agrilactobacillus fermenti]|uniref:MgtC/SapB family protein n=1 Tax=Agrilactobacillus fermenti TaxID=2586909 RepID=UPI001E3E6446|nr:MgtC/SapB family protein [Agrilactobacillus fermenti]MCD2257350.1 MgtC/SapB family protein [Agrilactobacillus fermenti]